MKPKRKSAGWGWQEHVDAWCRLCKMISKHVGDLQDDLLGTCREKFDWRDANFNVSHATYLVVGSLVQPAAQARFKDCANRPLPQTSSPRLRPSSPKARFKDCANKPLPPTHICNGMRHTCNGTTQEGNTTNISTDIKRRLQE